MGLVDGVIVSSGLFQTKSWLLQVGLCVRMMADEVVSVCVDVRCVLGKL